jgi:hydroxymethylpyrimidine pyrophosphatase-like HAD family hydrolase
LKHEQILELFTGFSSLTLQEPSKQAIHKLSYYVPLDINHTELIDEMQKLLQQRDVSASLVWSVDEPAAIGLLDVLPERATKLHAVQFLMQKKDFALADTVFAGDSGNDLPVLISPLHSVLVANAADEIKKQAMHEAQEEKEIDALYIAKGDFHSMNGNYSAGILEGLAYFIPETEHWW